jgi:hypothetical protein
MPRQLGASLQSERGSLPEQRESDMSLKFTDGDLTIHRRRRFDSDSPGRRDWALDGVAASITQEINQPITPEFAAMEATPSSPQT